MDAPPFGVEGVTPEDRAYAGSRFSDVQDALLSTPYQNVWGAPDAPPLPVYQVTLSSVLAGLLAHSRPYFFRKATERTVDSAVDLRWGSERRGFRRLLHPNGICMTGMWEITEDTGYSGYFRKGSRALTVARYSTCCSEPRRGHSRSLAMVGKLFPTDDAGNPAPLCPASFITQQDIAGDYTDFVNDAVLLNAPDTTAWRRGSGIGVLVVTGAVLSLVDRKPTIRQLYQIAELGKPASEATRAPTFMRFIVAPDQPRIAGADLDFRDEVMAQIYDRGDPMPKRTLTFHIEVTDDGVTKGLPVFERRTFRNWRRIGKITFDRAAASYNGDFVIHFNHPTWRDDQNDPATATRIDGVKVRWWRR